MRLRKLNDWLQLLASVAVLLGVLLVVQELRQGNQVATADRVSALYSEWIQVTQFKYENTPLVLMQKAIEQPDDLSDSDIAKLDAFYELLWTAHMHQMAVDRIGLSEFDLEISIKDLVFHCNNRVGRAWIHNNRFWLVEEPLLIDTVTAELDRIPIPSKFQYLADLRKAAEQN